MFLFFDLLLFIITFLVTRFDYILIKDGDDFLYKFKSWSFLNLRTISSLTASLLLSYLTSDSSVLLNIAMHVLLFIVVYDIQYLIISDMNIFALFLLFLYTSWQSNFSTVISNCIVAIAVYVFFTALSILHKGGLGGADIPLFAVCSLLVGKDSTFTMIAVATVLYIICIFPFIMSRILTMKTKIPLGPFIAVSTAFCLMFPMLSAKIQFLLTGGFVMWFYS